MPAIVPDTELPSPHITAAAARFSLHCRGQANHGLTEARPGPTANKALSQKLRPATLIKLAEARAPIYSTPDTLGQSPAHPPETAQHDRLRVAVQAAARYRLGCGCGSLVALSCHLLDREARRHGTLEEGFSPQMPPVPALEESRAGAMPST